MHFPHIEITWQGKVIFGVLLVAAILWLSAELRQWKNRYIGVGWLLRARFTKDNAFRGVFVSSRLLDSPADKAGIRGQHAEELIEYNGISVRFTSKQGFVDFFKEMQSTLKVGDAVRCKLRRNDEIFEIEMHAEVIRGPIPEHLPAALPSPYDADYHDCRYGMAVCTRTGYWVPTMRLSDAGFDKIFGT